MNSDLLNTLVKKHIVAKDTEIEICYFTESSAKDIATIEEIVAKRRKVKHIIAYRNIDGSQIEVTPDAIVAIDGMDPARLADVFNINEDGSAKKLKLDEFGNPVRRGRKPKHPRPQSIHY